MRNQWFAIRAGVAMAALGLIGSVLAVADEAEPTPTPLASNEATKRPKTLADLAGGIKLQQPKGQDEEGVVIDNSNLKVMGEGAVVTQGKALGSSAFSSRSGDQDGEGLPKTSQAVERARQKVRALEQQQAALADASRERDKTNMYTGAGPQYRPPGVVDPLDRQSDKIDRELDIAKKNLKAAERRARRNRSAGSQSEVPKG